MLKPQLFEPFCHKASGKPSLKRQRFKLVKDKTLALVRIDISRDKHRRVAWETKGNFTSLRATAAIIGGQRRNHSFFVFFSATGGVSALETTRQRLQSMVDCVRLPDPFLGYPSIENMVELVEGLVFPVKIETEYSDTRKREFNTILGLSLNPQHWAWESYHELVKLRGEEVPACALYDASPSTKLIINRRLAATVIREDGLTLAQRRVKQGRKRSAVIRSTRPQMDLVVLLEAG